ncbi:MAG TPA: SAM-dependent chlorinase/fluorinase, partial [Gemmatimonadales bacterium]|nr:SAM-dependent chlorinase/fluorinase [Gemmatimonadales bacterium]
MIITLLTDFGTVDSYVAELKAVLLSRAPSVTLVDITHQVAPGDIRAGQYLLGRTWAHFPAGTVHLAIVDPGVGTARRALAAEHGGHRFVAPDNGLLSFLPQDGHFVSLPVPTTAAATFHGRDVFAPA